MNQVFESCKAITFDLFGTILDLEGSIKPHISEFLQDFQTEITSEGFWQQFRHRQRIEQYQDSLMGLGHSGYLETVKKSFNYVCELNKMETTVNQVDTFMDNWKLLSPFPDCLDGLKKMEKRFSLVALSNGNPWFLEHLVKNRIKHPFDAIISVEKVGSFKPYPGVYRRAALEIALEPNEIIMVSSNSFDVMGARTCGFRGIYVNRYNLPFEDTYEQFKPDLTVVNFEDLSRALLM
ncbi:haloacid dehalogenase type II [Dehalococcoidia bacterium]|nr:haloacid dehalogenase type II [Dehalococcoidia bacterium]